MNLLLFIGNTNVKIFVLENESKIKFFDQKKLQNLNLKEEFNRLSLRFEPNKIEIFSVRADLNSDLVKFLSFKELNYKFWNLSEILEFSNYFSSINNLYQEFGLDRFLNILGAFELFTSTQKNFLIIDLGTCTTITGLKFQETDYQLSENLIFPGIEKQISSLREIRALKEAAKINKLNLSLARSLEQTDTFSTQGSILEAQTKIIFSLIESYQEENYQVLLTGGLSEVFKEVSGVKIKKDLFLDGYFALAKMRRKTH